MRIDIILFATLPILAVVGAIFSKQLKVSQSNKYIFLIIGMAIISGLVWSYISKYTKISLSVATVIYDLVYGLAYFFTFWALGETITLIQGVGVALAMAAIILLSI